MLLTCCCFDGWMCLTCTQHYRCLISNHCKICYHDCFIGSSLSALQCYFWIFSWQTLYWYLSASIFRSLAYIPTFSSRFANWLALINYAGLQGPIKRCDYECQNQHVVLPWSWLFYSSHEWCMTMQCTITKYYVKYFKHIHLGWNVLTGLKFIVGKNLLRYLPVICF